MFPFSRIKFKLFQRRYRKRNRHNYTSIGNFCDLSKVVVGRKTYGCVNVTDFSPADTKLLIGSYCSIAPNVRFLLGGEHQLDSISTYPFKVKSFGEAREAGSKGDIVVKDDVWIGDGAIICSGVTVGQGAVIAAGAVVTKDVEPYAIVGGNPARLIRYRLEEGLRTRLLSIDVTALFDSFTADDIDALYSQLSQESLEELLKKKRSLIMTNPKIIAFYLPQYHTFPENDEWWGKGFTEWTNIKKAKPLFKGHLQPRIPLNDNYYDLMDVNTFRWQIGLAKNYGIDGFCFYHYWFDGKLLMEKPLEMFLQNKDLNINYCFSWANEPWTRAWNGAERDVIMPQSYGGDDDIYKHFDYMLKYFQDDRYIKIDNKPVYLLYRSNSITYLENMIETWNVLAKENGFDGVYFVETLNSFVQKKECEKTDAEVYFEPLYANTQKSGMLYNIVYHFFTPPHFHKLIKRPYGMLWKKILKIEECGRTRWGGAFVDWDNSPRRGYNASLNVCSSVTKFRKYFLRRYEDAALNDCPFVFINAWNEWCEGAYLEPDTYNGYGYLESIKLIKERFYSTES